MLYVYRDVKSPPFREHVLQLKKTQVAHRDAFKILMKPQRHKCTPNVWNWCVSQLILPTLSRNTGATDYISGMDNNVRNEIKVFCMDINPSHIRLKPPSHLSCSWAVHEQPPWHWSRPGSAPPCCLFTRGGKAALVQNKSAFQLNNHQKLGKCSASRTLGRLASLSFAPQTRHVHGKKQKAWVKSCRKTATSTTTTAAAAAYFLLLFIFQANLNPPGRGGWKRKEKCKSSKILQ